LSVSNSATCGDDSCLRRGTRTRMSVESYDAFDVSACLSRTDHSDYDYNAIVNHWRLVVDSRNATKGINSEKIVHR